MIRISRRLPIALGLALFLFRGTTQADPPAEGPAELVHDFFPGEFESDRPLPQLTKLGKVLFFVASDLDTGRSVWRTDGTPAGTRRVPFPREPAVPRDPWIAGRVGSRVLWVTDDADAPGAWLVSAGRRGDGIVLHTFLFSPTAGSGTTTLLGERFFFEDCTATQCTILWTDGTPAGTGPVPALASFTDARQEIVGTFAGRWLVFRSGSAVYAYDRVGNRVLLLLPKGAQGPGGVRMYPVGDTLYLLTQHDRARLWVSRLSAPWAVQLAADASIDIAGWRDGRLYFATDNGRLWSTDGSPEGTRRYSGLRVEPYSVFADELGTLGPVTFVPMPGYYQGGLLAADEDRRELHEIYHLCSGKYDCLGSSMSAVTTAGGQGFLEIDGSLWQSDGTPDGTKPHDVLGKADPNTFRVIGDRLVLGATSHQGEQQLWETDGTARGTRALSDGDLDRPFWVQGQPMPFAGALYMAADQKPVGQQLWRVADGQATPVTDLRHLASGLEPTLAIPLGDRIVLQGAEANGWVSVAKDGSTETLPQVYDGCSEDPCPLSKIVLKQHLVFENGAELWTTDGTAAGTRAIALERANEKMQVAALGRWGDGALVLDRNGGLWTSDGSSARFFGQFPKDPDLYGSEEPVGPPLSLGPLTFLFRKTPIDDELAALELWRTDGTAAGTLRLASIPFDKDFRPYPNPALVGGRLFFRFLGVLWRSDGSIEGTQPFADQLPGGTFSLEAGTTALYAVAGDPATGPQTLWAIDPETLAASRLATSRWISGRPIGSVLANTLIFQAEDEDNGARWWVTEGTPESTHPVPEPLASHMTAMAFVAGERRWLSVCDSEHGCELWSTDRLGEDTRLVQDLWPGPRGSSPEILAVTEDALWLAATEPNVGRELWKIDLSPENP